MKGRTIEQIVAEVGWTQAKATPDAITIHVALTFEQLDALCQHVDRFIDEKSKLPRKTKAERDELDAMIALQKAWPYRWREDRL